MGYAKVSKETFLRIQEFEKELVERLPTHNWEAGLVTCLLDMQLYAKTLCGTIDERSPYFRCSLASDASIRKDEYSRMKNWFIEWIGIRNA